MIRMSEGNMENLLKNWSEIPYAFGGAALSGDGGGYGFGTIKDAIGLLEFAYDSGVTVYDTAPIYGFGESEKVLSQFIKNKREKVRVISKSGVFWQSSKRVDMTNDPKVTLQMLEDSLKRLSSEYIDLYMIHWPDPKIDIRYPLEVLAKAKEQGKILEIGLCNTTLDDLKTAKDVVDIRVVQSQHNLYEAPSSEIQNYLNENQISFMGWGVFDKGILTGRVTKKREQAKNYDESDCRRSAPWWVQKDVIAKCEKLGPWMAMAEELELSPSELAVNYALTPDFSDMVLVGAKKREDLESVLKTKRKPLSDDVRKELEKKCRL